MSEVADRFFLVSLENIAKWLKLSPDVAGATLLAFGTSAPELSTAMFALLFATREGSGIGVGTIVGSAIFQILVVIGFAAAVRTSQLNWKPILRDSVFYAISVILLIFVIHDNLITVLEAGILVSSYLIYLAVLLVWSRTISSNETLDLSGIEDNPEEKDEKEKNIFWKAFDVITNPIDKALNLIPDAAKNQNRTIPVFLLSLFLIGFCSYLMVFAGERLAIDLGLSPTIVALTILAGGTSIPEMISSAIVSRKGHGDMAIANAIGSNIFDILISLGLPVLIFTLFIGDLTDVGSANIGSSVFLLFVTLIVIALLAAQKFKATKQFGYFLIFLYVVYVGLAYTGTLESIDLQGLLALN
jgi:K+-dependent Na+/Ca+ exchanger-like protein